jgi:hypothetical protein
MHEIIRVVSGATVQCANSTLARFRSRRNFRCREEIRSRCRAGSKHPVSTAERMPSKDYQFGSLRRRTCYGRCDSRSLSTVFGASNERQAAMEAEPSSRVSMPLGIEAVATYPARASERGVELFA